MTSKPDAAGLAALALCESLLLSLTESGVIGAAEARAILEDAAAAQRNVPPEMADERAQEYRDAAAIIENILAGGNAARLP